MLVLEPKVALDRAAVGQDQVLGAFSLFLGHRKIEHDHLADGAYDTVVTNAIAQACLPAVESILAEAEVFRGVKGDYAMVRLDHQEGLFVGGGR